MEDALNFGTDKVFLNTGCHPRDLDREEGWKRTVDSIGRLAARAERLGVKLVLEQLQPYESNLLLNLEDMKRMLRGGLPGAGHLRGPGGHGRWRATPWRTSAPSWATRSSGSTTRQPS